ncbi:Predicted arabinose efflux permease, MFS family [Thermomonospora echinospora]|uniref:Predicted arabinose efflux permease, MFS family n=1 Tax=Thermomonospora echinospora TaxID=1992 RepID=A0A1H5S1C7_9ACTN|nr:MFS transporter [Thermomonospora echinospora]SEF44385.1 Predicted arabinose efflux permease, MFS family [Thermomonospora echinospora]
MTTTHGVTAPSDRPAPRLPMFLHERVGGLPRPFWVLWAGTLINRLGTMVEPFLGLYLTTVRGLSLGETGLVLAVLGLGSVFAQLIGGALADRIGRRVTLTLAMFLNAAGMLALGYAQGTVAITASALLLGLVLDMFRPASSALVADLIPPDERPRAFGLLFWAINLGFAVAMVLGGTLARAGFLWLFWADAVTCLVFGVLVWRAVPETRARRPKGERVPGGFADVLRDRVMAGYTLVFLAYTFVLMQAFTTLPLAMRADGLSPQAYGLAVAGNGVLIIVAQPLVNTWLVRRDHSLVIGTGLLVVAVGTALYTAASSLWSYAAVVLVWTAGEVAIAAVGQAVVADLAPEHLRGRYSALWGVSWSGGFLLAPLIGTRLLEAGAPVLWLTCAAVCAVAALGQFALGPAVRRRVAELRARSC